LQTRRALAPEGQLFVAMQTFVRKQAE